MLGYNYCKMVYIWIKVWSSDEKVMFGLCIKGISCYEH